jgi:hypothetical protein
VQGASFAPADRAENTALSAFHHALERRCIPAPMPRAPDLRPGADDAEQRREAVEDQRSTTAYSRPSDGLWRRAGGASRPSSPGAGARGCSPDDHERVALQHLAQSAHERASSVVAHARPLLVASRCADRHRSGYRRGRPTRQAATPRDGRDRPARDPWDRRVAGERPEREPGRVLASGERANRSGATAASPTGRGRDREPLVQDLRGRVALERLSHTRRRPRCE